MGLIGNSNSRVSNEETTIIMPEIGMGIKAFITRSSALRIAVKFVHEENSLDFLGSPFQNVDNNSLQISAGYSVFLGR